MTTTGLVLRRELAAGLRARWFLAYALVFLAAGVLFAAFGGSGVALSGYRGLAKAFAGLVHLALLFVPLMAVIPAVAALADERESGALEYLLAQPVTAAEVYLGKWLGLSATMFLSLTVGFGVAGSVAVAKGVPPGLLLVLFGFVLLLAQVFVGFGLLFAAATSTRARATTLALSCWLVLVALGTVGVMLAFVRWGVPAGALTLWSFLNPIEVFRLGVVAVLDPDLSLLGPVGARVLARLGTGGTVMLAGLSLLAWGVGPGLLGLAAFRRRG